MVTLDKTGTITGKPTVTDKPADGVATVQLSNMCLSKLKRAPFTGYY